MSSSSSRGVSRLLAAWHRVAAGSGPQCRRHIHRTPSRSRTFAARPLSTHLSSLPQHSLHVQPQRQLVSQAVVAVVVLSVAWYVRAKWREIRSMRPDLQSGPRDPLSSSAAPFHEGGFADRMDRREAALILGVRENASRERIMERYRQLMKVNHPDLGGSPYVSTKINEAKELLSKTARSSSDEHTSSSSSTTQHRDRDRRSTS